MSHCNVSCDAVFAIAVKFILSTLGYIAEVVLKSVGQENETMEDDASSMSDGEIVDSEVQELMMDNMENVSAFHCSLKCQ